MDLPYDLILPLSVWFGFFCLIVLFARMHLWAKKQKGAAFAIGMFVQMFLPDPTVQQTIECVVEAKQKEQKKSSVSPSDNKNKK